MRTTTKAHGAPAFDMAFSSAPPRTNLRIILIFNLPIIARGRENVKGIKQKNHRKNALR